MIALDLELDEVVYSFFSSHHLFCICSIHRLVDIVFVVTVLIFGLSRIYDNIFSVESLCRHSPISSTSPVEEGIFILTCAEHRELLVLI